MLPLRPLLNPLPAPPKRQTINHGRIEAALLFEKFDAKGQIFVLQGEAKYIEGEDNGVKLSIKGNLATPPPVTTNRDWLTMKNLGRIASYINLEAKV